MNKEEQLINRLLTQIGVSPEKNVLVVNDNGVTEETPWDTLSEDEQANMLISALSGPSYDDNEIEFLKYLKEQQSTPRDFVRATAQEYYNKGRQDVINELSDAPDDSQLIIKDILDHYGADNISDEQAALLYRQIMADKEKSSVLANSLREKYNREQLEALDAKKQAEREEKVNTLNDIVEQALPYLQDVKYAEYGIKLDNDDIACIRNFIAPDMSGESPLTTALQDPQSLAYLGFLATQGNKLLKSIIDSEKTPSKMVVAEKPKETATVIIKTDTPHSDEDGFFMDFD